MATYDRYTSFRANGLVDIVPFIEIATKSDDKYVVYKKGKSRLDLISNEYYGDPNYGWLILQANPGVGSTEHSILDNTTLRIPYPLTLTIEMYKLAVKEYLNQQGND